ncbi:hypothetical protein CABS01_16850 [Colletotrichum abscissum]|uniref:uncharacterized protein n=1 Tax=Colletotrichum abscissum TaxID=1671311 RepID=UPI0027D5413B|nr:uncharacterized protein CABS01_16850 [Colletotrichum abscissum]KAK1509296.1 hypothetical protein CABS01_16850 [Colletotrichum abscissum]
MSDVEQVVAQLRDAFARFESVMNETNTMPAEGSSGYGHQSESWPGEDVGVQAGDEPDSPVVGDSRGVLLAPVRRGREGYDSEAVKPELKRKKPPYSRDRNWFPIFRFCKFASL